jgi:hypothetical protein
VTPGIVAKGAMIFQPSNERRRSGSHYTPSSLTGPIVEAALAPVLKQLGDNPTPAQILNLKVCDPAMGSGAFLVEACRQLGDALSRAWNVHNERPILPPDEDEALHAQRQIAQRCLYGVDKNPMATDLAKLSLWLATLAKDHPFTFLDHSLRAGDSLVGLTRKQIAAFHWNPSEQMSLLEDRIRRKVEAVSNYRQQIFAARDDVPYALLKQKLDAAEDDLSLPRQIGDAVIASFFAGEKAKDRENIRTALSDQLTSNLRDHGFIAVDGAIDKAIAKLKTGSKSIHPFHWGLEFPEVFSVDERGEQIGGFDVIVGNPPFSGVVQTAFSFGEKYTEYLRLAFPPAGGKTDLVAFFFRRAFSLTRIGGAFGLIATNTIGQGDTRESGLAYICDRGGVIFRARKRMRWPGAASVIVSVVWVSKNRDVTPRFINDNPVKLITAFLFHEGGHHEPSKLQSCPAIASKGVVPYGMGFTFEDGRDDCSPVVQAKNLLALDERNADVIKRFVGGEDLNSIPSCCPDRFIVDFGEMSEMEAARWPAILEIVRQWVQPTRFALTTQSGASTLKQYWWRYAFSAKEVREAKRTLTRVLVTSQTSKHRIFCFLPADWVFDQKVIVFANDSWNFFGVMSSRPHEIWASFFGSTMKDDPVYTPPNCFNTFPFPLNFDVNPLIGSLAISLHEFRESVMLHRNEGLTSICNRINDPNEDSADIKRLRELHAAMDRAVLDAYGWQDLQPVCEFLPEFDDEEEEDEGGHPKKKKYRYRWPDEIHDEVLARLLDLNRQRALEEGQLLAAEEAANALITAANKKSAKKSSRKKPGQPPSATLFGTEEEGA